MGQDVLALIAERYGNLTKKQRQVADCMKANQEAMSFMTLRELSAAARVSEMTVLHTCTALGFSNYNDVKYEFRRSLNLQGKLEVQRENAYANPDVPDYELDDHRKLMSDICREERESTIRFFEKLKPADLFAAADMMIEAGCTVFCGRGVSLQVVEFLSMRLATLGMPSVVMNTEQNDSLHAALPLLGRGTLLIAASMPDYYLMTTKVCEFARQRRSKLLCLTDGPTSPVAALADLTLFAPTSTRLFLNTLGTMMILANLLSSAVDIEKSRHKTNRFSSPEEFSRLFVRE